MPHLSLLPHPHPPAHSHTHLLPRSSALATFLSQTGMGTVDGTRDSLLPPAGVPGSGLRAAHYWANTVPPSALEGASEKRVQQGWADAATVRGEVKVLI